jgi:molybdate transport system substrate-binding protein
MYRELMAILISACACVQVAAADEIRVAVASNFRHASEDLAPRFKKSSGHDAVLIFGSTGKHFAQIVNGAPFDVLLAADELRPRMLEEDGLIVSGSRFVYATGRLVMWSADANAAVNRERLVTGDFRFLALANPTLAPYGRAARQALTNLGVWQSLQPRLVRGENVAQAYQFVVSGNAELGLIALAQIRLPGGATGGAHWEIPRTLYDPIRQQAALLSDTPATRAFAKFMRSAEARAVIRGYGYETP